MPGKYKKQLQKKAEEYIGFLADDGFSASIIKDSFREYNVKISICKGDAEIGKVNIYFSPKKDSFKILTNEIKDKTAIHLLEDCWYHRGELLPGNIGYHVYVDGSFLRECAGYGVVVLKDNRVIEELCGEVKESPGNDSRQIIGEISAVKKAIEWCKKKSVKEVTIHYDYKGLEEWASSRWKTNQSLTREYAAFVRDCGLRIHWNKVDSHKGNRWNERADQLAKKGAGG
ncbi:RNase H family protein [Elusimicrobiota bacterium]